MGVQTFLWIRRLALLTFLFCRMEVFAQQVVDTAAIKAHLRALLDRDQKTRKGLDSVAYRHAIDSSNLAAVEQLIGQYGWPGKQFVGASGNQTVFLVIQHAELPVQEKYFPLMQRSVEAGESNASDLALLQDRIYMRQGKKQVYGTQVIFNKSGGQEFYPIDDEKNVNARRAKVGLQPIEEYARYFGIEYSLPSGK